MERFKHLYGPVPSRRLGRSLGVDLVPHKVCTYDCVYCQIGKTTEETLLRKEYVPKGEILEEMRGFFQEGASKVDYISLGGSGEPTLHSKIGSIIRSVKKLTSIPVAVITNGALLWMEDVRNDLLEADVILPSLDAISQEVFSQINRPSSGISVEKVIEGLVQFREVYHGQIWLEILFCKGINDHPEELRKMKEAIERIRPDLVHLNTVVRPPSEGWVLPLTEQEMEAIQQFFGEKASVISDFNLHVQGASSQALAETILSILRRRPLSLTDLSMRMGLPENEIDGALTSLLKEGLIQRRIFGEAVYYEEVVKKRNSP